MCVGETAVFFHSSHNFPLSITNTSKDRLSKTCPIWTHCVERQRLRWKDCNPSVSPIVLPIRKRLNAWRLLLFAVTMAMQIQTAITGLQEKKKSPGFKWEDDSSKVETGQWSCCRPAYPSSVYTACDSWQKLKQTRRLTETNVFNTKSQTDLLSDMENCAWMIITLSNEKNNRWLCQFMPISFNLWKIWLEHHTAACLYKCKYIASTTSR